jgi:hypothetical protein
MGHLTFNVPASIRCLIKKSISTLEATLGMRSKNCIITTVPRVHVIINPGFHKDANIDSHLMHGTKRHIQIAISATSNV